MTNNGFGTFKPKGHHLISNANNNEKDTPHIGQFRVTFEYDKCSEATIIAMQVESQEKASHDFSFEKWMPNIASTLNQPVSKDQEEPFCGPMFCYLCMCVNGLFSLLWEEAIDHAADGL